MGDYKITAGEERRAMSQDLGGRAGPLVGVNGEGLRSEERKETKK